MKLRTTILTIAATLLFAAVTAQADEYDDALAVFKAADSSKSYFAKSYGYGCSRLSARRAWSSAPAMARAACSRRGRISAIRRSRS